MAGRPPKQGIDFSPWEVGIFENDTKIDKLIDAQGCVGFTIYFYLCQKAYGSHGYYYPWCFDDSATTARRLGGGASASSVEETVKLCFRVGLLDEELYDRWKILTSRGIQTRFLTIALKRTYKSVISEYWLLSDEESEGLVKVALKDSKMRIIPAHNSIMPADNSDLSNSKGKERKAEDSKGKEIEDAIASSRPERENAPDHPPVISLILNDKTEYPVYQLQVDEWATLYPAVDSVKELSFMDYLCRAKRRNGVYHERAPQNVWMA